MRTNHNINKYFQKQKFVSGLLGALIAMAPATVTSQNSYTFSTCTATGNTGPTQAMVTSAYVSTPLAGSVTVGAQQGIQIFTVSSPGIYRIEAWGAQGYGTSGVGGRGAYMSGDFNLTAGQVLKILVGQQGELNSNSSYNAQFGGGGGSFVTDITNTPLIVAGGGGGNWASAFSTIADAPVTTSGNNGGGSGATNLGTGGTAGAGGTSGSSADGGGGLTGNGGGTAAGVAFINGGNGGFSTYGIGGFGGGGGTSSFNNRRGGGGGGYSGGGGAEGGTTGFPEAGGGGSFNSGTNQTNTAGVNLGHGKVVITRTCLMTLGVSSSTSCVGGAVTLTTDATGVTWNTGSNSPTIVVSPTVTSAYSFTGTGYYSTGSGTAACTSEMATQITVYPVPVLSSIVSPTQVCAGGTATVTPMGGASYSISGTPFTTYTISPASNTVITFSGSNGVGCVSTQTFQVKVNPNAANITASSTTVCAGSPATLTASGINSYTWSNGGHFSSISVTPTTTTTYSVAGYDNFFCMLTKVISIAANPKPSVTAVSDKSLVCKGEIVNLSATGANTYTWNNGITGPAALATLSVDITYNFSVIGASANGCKDTAYVSVVSSKCSGISESQQNSVGLLVYPNPAKGVFTFESVVNGDKNVEIIDMTGKVVYSSVLKNDRESVDLTSLASGVYYAKIRTSEGRSVIKLVKE